LALLLGVVYCCCCYRRKVKTLELKLTDVKAVAPGVQSGMRSAHRASFDSGEVPSRLLQERRKEADRWLVLSIWRGWTQLVQQRHQRAVLADAFNKRHIRLALEKDRRYLRNILVFWRLEVKFALEMRRNAGKPPSAESSFSTGFEVLGSLFSNRGKSRDQSFVAADDDAHLDAPSVSA